MRRYVHGDVLDIGGYDFFLTAKTQRISYTSWTTLEPSQELIPSIDDPAFHAVQGDGCNMHQIADRSFDTVLNIQVLEHVFEPIRMVEEMARVLRPGGHAILLIPQTGTLHLAPHHYYNFTRYWIEEAFRRSKLDIVELRPLGGRWSSTASHAFFFFLQSGRYPSMHVPNARRPFLFFVLFPFMAITAVLLIPIALLLSLGDSPEEPNNHLVVVRKPM